MCVQEVRIDAADGVLDGKANRRKLKFGQQGLNGKEGHGVRAAGGYALLDGECEKAAASEATGLPNHAQLRAALEAARIKFGAERRCGGRLPYFMLYDLVVLVVVGTQLGISLTALRAQGAPEWLIWTRCYYAKLVWALMSFPFIVFAVPVVGSTLHGSKATGYDQAGKLVPQLSSAKMKKKIAIEAKVAQRQRAYDATADGAALRIQSMYRGTRVRRGRLARHVVSLFTPVGLFVPASTIERWFD